MTGEKHPPPSVKDLEVELGKSIAVKEYPRALSRLRQAQAAVRLALGPTAWAAIAAEPQGHEYTLVRDIIIRSAATRFTNPRDRAHYSGPEGLAFTPSPDLPARMISPDDLDYLATCQLQYEAGFG